MSSDLVKRPEPVPASEMELYKEQVRLVVNTEMVPTGLRGNVYKVLAAMLYGREIGLEAMESLSEIAIVDGRPSLSAKAMVKLARRAGHSITGESDEEKAVVKGVRGDNGDEMTVTYTYAQAEKVTRKGKKLVDGDNWQNYREDMLWARAVSRLCRRLFADTFGSLPYAPEELAPHVDTAEGRMESALDLLPEDETVVIEQVDEGAGGDADDPSKFTEPPEKAQAQVAGVDGDGEQVELPLPADVKERLGR